MASNTKNSRKRQKRKEDQRKKRKARLKKRQNQGDFPRGGFVVAPHGEAKMSEVIKAFVEPYLHFAETEKSRRTLFSLAMIAWNSALLPEEQREDVIEKSIDNTSEAEIVQGLLRAMIERKLAYFADNQRMIMDFELTELGEGEFHLAVISTLQD